MAPTPLSHSFLGGKRSTSTSSSSTSTHIATTNSTYSSFAAGNRDFFASSFSRQRIRQPQGQQQLQRRATRMATAVAAVGRNGGGGAPPVGDGDGDDAAPTAAAAPRARAAAAVNDGFAYWTDELLWTQGYPAVELIEEVLESFGGRRAGGPRKPPRGSTAAGAAAGAANAAASTGGGPAAGVVAALAARLGLGQGAHNGAAAAAAAASDEPSAAQSDDAGPPAAAAAASNQLLQQQQQQTPPPRADEHLLGYRHVGEWGFLWTKSVYGIKAARAMQAGQVVSAIAGLNCLTMKKRMVATLKGVLGPDLAARVSPLSFCLPEELPQWRAWLRAHPDEDTGLWMLKTGQDAGKGLRLVPTCSALQAAAQAPRHPARPHTHLKVAQRYVTDPLLLDGRKFHFRLWMLVTGHAPLRAYLHDQGLVLFSSAAYEPDRPLAAGVRPAASHVTNLARNEDTWVWSLDTFAARLEQLTGDSGAWPRLWREMRESAALCAAAALPSLRAAHAWLRPPVAAYGFQMVGLDFLIDVDLRPWLLEVNSAPSIMAVHSDDAARALIRGAKSAMLSDVVAMVAHRLNGAAAGAPAADGGSGGGDSGSGSGAAGSSGSGVNGSGGTANGSSSSPAAGQRRRPRPLRPRANGDDDSAGGWRAHVEAEMAARGGFEPLIRAFPHDLDSVPWATSDRELRALWDERGWP